MNEKRGSMAEFGLVPVQPLLPALDTFCLAIAKYMRVVP